jgi:hypothetical protein
VIYLSRADFRNTFREVLSDYLGKFQLSKSSPEGKFSNCLEEQRNHIWEDEAEKKGQEWHSVRKFCSLS